MRGILVRFTPKSGHWDSAVECPLCAKSRHLWKYFKPLFLRRRFRFQGLKPVCIQHSPRRFLVDMRANLFMKCTELLVV